MRAAICEAIRPSNGSARELFRTLAPTCKMFRAAARSLAIACDAGRRLQLTRVIQILRDAFKDVGVGTLTRIRTDIAALPDREVEQLPAAKISMGLAKAAALDDLTRFERDHTNLNQAAVESWRKSTIDQYERLIARLAR